jgi:hypothetical protein
MKQACVGHEINECAKGAWRAVNKDHKRKARITYLQIIDLSGVADRVGMKRSFFFLFGKIGVNFGLAHPELHARIHQEHKAEKYKKTEGHFDPLPSRSGHAQMIL